MSDLHPPFDPHKSLRRAAKIPPTNGHVLHELENGSSALSVTIAKTRRSGIGASLKGRFKTHSERSKSLNDALFLVAPIQKDGLARSPSNVGISSHPSCKTNIGCSHQLSETLNSAVLAVSESTTTPLPETMENITVPEVIQRGTLMTKVSLKKNKNVVLRVEADLGQIVWESRQQKIIPIENIKEIRSGSDARYYRQQFQLSRDYEDRWLTIIYVLDGAWKTLHLIATTKDIFRMWDKTLREQHAIRQELMHGLGNPEMRETLWEKHYWKGADEGGDQKLTFDEVEKLCRGLNIKSSREDLGRLFTEADVQKRGYLDFSDFQRFVKLLKGRPEINRVYQKLKGEGVFDFAVFEIFMLEQQKSLLSQTELKALFDKYTPDDSHSSMSLDAFTSFLLSPDNSPFSDQHRNIWHDMTRPFPEYFIASSHNTYLVGHQLVGDSTIEGYIRALLQGCRSVEVDIYDGENEPTIFHGKTLTSKVSLREVCEVIAKYGFIASPYPIIISAEVHCSLPQQDLIAEIMIEVFGEMLVRKLPGDTPMKSRIDVLPSPEDLRGKILFKTKNHVPSGIETSESDGGFTTEPSSSASDSDILSEAFQDASTSASASTPVPIPTGGKITQRRSQSGQIKEQLLKARTVFLQHVRGAYAGSTVAPDAILDLGLSQSPPSDIVAFPPTGTASSSASKSSPGEVTSPRVKTKISSALLALLVYTVGVKCRGINKKEQYAPEHMFSLSENAANKMLRFNMWDVIKHTKSHMVRIYPKGTRVSSTNYEPHKFWAAGAQLVALNWQTPDLGCMLNHAMFQRNGRSGYVLKPMALRQNSAKDLLLKRTKHTLDITIISAQQLPHRRDAFGKEVQDKAIVDPFVEVTLYVPDWPVRPTKPKEGSTSKETEDPLEPFLSPTSTTSSPTSTSTRARSVRTSVVRKNGFNPVWEEKLSIPFECVGDMFDLVFVKFVVGQEDRSGDEPLALYCASLGSLQRGYRHLPLHDSQLSQYLYSTLFVKTDVVDTS